MPELKEIKGKLDINGLVCCLTIDKALREIEEFRELGDETSVAILQTMVDALIDALEPIEE
tara:strand:+ start:840 stop:1022 length:183 start_codon:yes stop_codon:yes gene_type:complete